METGGRTGFGETTTLADARDALADCCDPLDRTDDIPVEAADERVLATAVTAERAIPHYERAAKDGWAVRAADTLDASDGSPTRLEPADEAVGEGTAVRVHAGGAMPAGADAVVRVESVDRRMEGLAVYEAVAEGANVGPVGEDVAAGATLFERGRRLAPADLALCRGTGVTEVEVVARPSVAVVPTGEELVTGEVDPAPGEMVETNELMVAQYCRRWGAEPTARDVVADDVDALAAALERDADHDLVVTTGGSSVGQRDVVAPAVREVGEMRVHGVGIEPGHPVGVGTVESEAGTTPVLVLPGSPVSCLVTTVQFVRPAIGHLVASDLPPIPTSAATLTRKLPSEVGTRTFARVRFRDAGGPETLPGVEPIRTGGAGVLSSVAGADGWVEIPESAEGLPGETTVTVQHWDRGC